MYIVYTTILQVTISCPSYPIVTRLIHVFMMWWYSIIYVGVHVHTKMYGNIFKSGTVQQKFSFTYKDKTQFTQFVKWKFLSWYMLYIYWSSCIYEFYLCNKTFIYTALYIYFTSLLEKRRHSVPKKCILLCVMKWISSLHL